MVKGDFVEELLRDVEQDVTGCVFELILIVSRVFKCPLLYIYTMLREEVS